MSQLSTFAEEGKVCPPIFSCERFAKSYSALFKITPVVEQVRSFEELPAAYEKVSFLQGRGKTVLKW